MVRVRTLWMLFLLMLGMFFFLEPGTASFAANTKDHQQSSKGSTGGVKASDFTLKDTEGKTFRLSSNKGKRAVMLYFWATSCPHSRRVESKVAAMRESYSPEQLEIYAINSGESLEKIKRYREARKLPYIVLLDDGGAVAEKYGLEGVPGFVLISKDAKVVYRDYAVPEEKEIKKKLGISPGPAAASGEAKQKGGEQLITRLSDDALEQIMDKAEIVYKFSDPVYLLMEEGIVLANSIGR